jgi:hypothetical protein
VSLAVAVGAEIADSERETELADVGRERPLTNLLRNPCGIAPHTRGPCAERTELAELRIFFMGLSRCTDEIMASVHLAASATPDPA